MPLFCPGSDIALTLAPDAGDDARDLVSVFKFVAFCEGWTACIDAAGVDSELDGSRPALIAVPLSPNTLTDFLVCCPSATTRPFLPSLLGSYLFLGRLCCEMSSPGVLTGVLTLRGASMLRKKKEYIVQPAEP